MTEKKEKKRRGRYAYLNDYVKNDNDEYEYQGNVYAAEMDSEEKKTAYRRYLIILAVILLLLAISGSLPFEGLMKGFYVIIPFITEVGFTMLTIGAAYRIYSHDEFKEHVYKKSVLRIRSVGPGMMGSTIIRCVASLVYLLLNGIKTLWAVLVYFLLIAAIFILETQSVQPIMKTEYKLIRNRKPQE